MEAVVRLVRYVKQSPGVGILLFSAHSPSLIAYSDVDWASCQILDGLSQNIFWQFSGLLEIQETVNYL